MIIQRKGGATKKRARSSSSKSFKIPGLPHPGSFILGIVIGIAITAFVYFKFATSEVTIKLPNSQSSVEVEDIQTEERIEEVALVNEPQFDFYTELTKSSQPDNKPKVLDLKSKQKPIHIYQVQAGSFKKRADAEALKAELALNGINTKIESATLSNGEVWYRVITGAFKNQAAAVAQNKSIKSIAKIDGAIVHRPAN